MSQLHLLITHFSLQTSSFDDPFHMNGVFKGKLDVHISLNLVDEGTKVIHFNNNYKR